MIRSDISCMELREIRKTTMAHDSTSVQCPYTMSTAEHFIQGVTVKKQWEVWEELEMLNLTMSEVRLSKALVSEAEKSFFAFLVRPVCFL